MNYCPFCMLRSRSDTPQLDSAPLTLESHKAPEVSEEPDKTETGPVEETPPATELSEISQNLESPETDGEEQEMKAIPEAEENSATLETPESARINEIPPILEIKLAPDISRVIITFEKADTPIIKANSTLETEDAQKLDLSAPSDRDESNEMLEIEYAYNEPALSEKAKTPEAGEPDLAADTLELDKAIPPPPKSNELADGSEKLESEVSEAHAARPTFRNHEIDEINEDAIPLGEPALVQERFKITETRVPLSPVITKEIQKQTSYQMEAIPPVIERNIHYRTRRKRSAMDAMRLGRKRRFRIIASDPIGTLTSRNARLRRF